MYFCVVVEDCARVPMVWPVRRSDRAGHTMLKIGSRYPSFGTACPMAGPALARSSGAMTKWISTCALKA